MSARRLARARRSDPIPTTRGRCRVLVSALVMDGLRWLTDVSLVVEDGRGQGVETQEGMGRGAGYAAFLLREGVDGMRRLRRSERWCCRLRKQRGRCNWR